MLYTLDFLGVNTDEILSVLTPVKNEFGKYSTILESELKEFDNDIDNFIMGVLSMSILDGFYCIGIIINSKNEVKIFEKSKGFEFTWYEYSDLKVIEALMEVCNPDAVAIVQEIDNGEYRVVSKEIYELNNIIRIKDGEIKYEN